MEIDGRSIFGYFSDRNDAEQAKEQLLRAGFNDTQLDSVRHDEPIGASTPTLSAQFDSLSELTLGTQTGDDTGILLAADTAASGMAGRGQPPLDKAWLIVTVTDGSDEQVERAVKILKSNGADV